MTPLDPAWLRANPLPSGDGVTDKNSRGRVLAAGGSLLCPGALMLTAQAALRAGAGKVQMATVAATALPLGLAMPETAVIALPADADGEIAAAAAEPLRAAMGRCDAFVLGPGMGGQGAAGALLGALLADPSAAISLVLDAAAVACAGVHAEAIRGYGGRAVLTPHHGEMAALTGHDADAIAAAPERIARETAARFGAVVVLKAGETVVSTPDGTVLGYAGGGIGLATGGSGDVLAGIVGGLLARGAPPLVAAGWGVWLHGEAGRRLGPIGFLARELPPLVPGLMAAP